MMRVVTEDHSQGCVRHKKDYLRPMRNAILTLCLLIQTSVFAQEAIESRPSPLALATIRYKDTYVKITYSRPQKRGREIFGGIVPYGKVWRTGANEATEITATRDVVLKGTLLKAGTYSIFTIPEKDKWTIIINRDIGLWGSYNYNQKQDVMRFDVPVAPITDVTYEPLTLKFNQRNDVADLLILWDRTSVSIPLKFIL
jgi:hypothetical protein